MDGYKIAWITKKVHKFGIQNNQSIFQIIKKHNFSDFLNYLIQIEENISCPIYLKQNLEKGCNYFFCKCGFYVKNNIALKDIGSLIRTKIDTNDVCCIWKLIFNVIGIGRCERLTIFCKKCSWFTDVI